MEELSTLKVDLKEYILKLLGCEITAVSYTSGNMFVVLSDGRIIALKNSADNYKFAYYIDGMSIEEYIQNQREQKINEILNGK